MKIIFSREFNEKERQKISKIIYKVLQDLRLYKKISKIYLNTDIRLKNDVNIDYSKIKKGFVKISFGKLIKKRHDKNILYHEIGHVHDIFYNKIIFNKKIKKLPRDLQMLAGLILNFSLDGRLAKSRLPHISYRERKNSLNSVEFLSDKQKKELLYYWGKRFTSSSEVIKEAKNLNSLK